MSTHMSSGSNRAGHLFGVLHVRTYRHLLGAQVIALLGTGILTVALALLAYDLAGSSAGAVLGTALTIKIVAYVALSPVAAALTDRLPARRVMVSADLVRAGVAGLLPLVDSVWQVYVLILLLQAASATFTPTFQAVIPSVLTDERDYTRALSWSRIAYDLESLVSPTIAAALLTVVSFHDLFFGTVVGFLGSALLVLTVSLPGRTDADLRVPFVTRLTSGVRAFLSQAQLRALLALDLVVASATALVLVNTVVLVHDVFGKGDRSVAVLLACFGAGSIVAALGAPNLLAWCSDRALMLASGVATGVVLAAAAIVIGGGPASGWLVVAGMWVALGALGALVTIPSTRIVTRASTLSNRQAFFSAHFSLSHACYLVTYPIAGWAGSTLGQGWAAALLALIAGAAALAAIAMWPGRSEDASMGPTDSPHGRSDGSR